MGTIIDHEGSIFTVADDAHGLTIATWQRSNGTTEHTAPAWMNDVGTVFLPFNCQAAHEQSVQGFTAIGSWVEATTGIAAVIHEGVPHLPPFAPPRPTQYLDPA